MHVVSVDDLTSDFIDEVFQKARYFRLGRQDQHGVHSWANIANSLPNRLLATVFFEPSTRTRLSFEAAMTYLGGKIIGTENAAEFSSLKKGASIEDEFQVISGYCDVIVGRFTQEGDAQRAASVSTVPLINGGDGAGEHPTQALIDLFIIQDKLWHQKTLTVTFMGDNERSRTVRSLSKLLARDPNVQQNFIKSPVWAADPYWQIHHGYKDERTLIRPRVLSNGIEIDDYIRQSDVVYVTREQVERIEDQRLLSEAERHRRAKPFVFGQHRVNMLPEHALILHPLPRTSELPVEVDSDPRAHYFEQARNGLFIRMALLESLLA